MEEKLDLKVMKLEKEIVDITKNINKFKNKNHITMFNLMEKIKSFTNELKIKNDNDNHLKTSYENKKKILIKTYQNLSNEKMTSNNTNSNRLIDLHQNKYNNKLATNNETVSLYLNNNFVRRKKNLSNINYKYETSNTNRYNTNENNEGSNTSKPHVNKCFSLNFDHLMKNNQEHEDIKEREKNNSINNINTFRNNLITSCSNDESKIQKNFKGRNKIHKKQILKKVNSYNYNKKIISKKAINDLKILSLNINKKPNQKTKKDHCNVNITEYYKNLNSYQIKNMKKSNNKIMSNKKRTKNYLSARNNIYKLYKKNIINGKYPRPSLNYLSRNYVNNMKNNENRTNDDNNTYENKITCHTITVNEKDCIANSTFNPYSNNNNYKTNDSERGEIVKGTRKSLNSFREKIPYNKNFIITNNEKTILLNNNQPHRHYHFQNKLAKNFNNNLSSYNTLSNRNKSNMSYELIENTNANTIVNIKSNNNDNNNNNNNRQTNNNKNYSQDFIDIITNRNNTNYKYDYESIYNNNINQKDKAEDNSDLYKYTVVNEKQYNNLLSKLNCKNFDECLDKTDNISEYEEFINNIRTLYNKYNMGNGYNNNKNVDLNEILEWIRKNVEENRKSKKDLKKYENTYGKIKEGHTIETLENSTNSKNNIINTINKKKVNRILDYGTEKTKNDSRQMNTEKLSTIHKENRTIICHNYNSSYDNSAIRNRDNYSIHSFTNCKNFIDNSKKK